MGESAALVVRRDWRAVGIIGADVPLSYADILAATGGKIGCLDVACPECGPQARAPSNKTRKVLRVWDDGEFATYNCARCGMKGWAKDDGASKSIPRQPVASEPKKDTQAIASFLWSGSRPLSGSLAETYLRSRSCFLNSATIRFLPPRNEHPPAMIARFGDENVTGVHITRLCSDGRGKAGTEKDKIMLGESMGQPIIVHDNSDRGELLIAEGIEDAATLAVVTGWSAWAAGSWVRMAPVVAAAARFDRIYFAVDHDRDGLKALGQSRVIRPDLVPVDFAKALSLRERMDANKTMLRYGADAVMAVIEFSDAQARHGGGEIGYEAMARAVSRANDVFTRIVLA